ncbi:MAG TPA: hypothetical protein VME20_08890 [Acidimicrobiales bacterium]|nr:hypothetical protein [Acidimicrobiales bacterium]
MPVAPAIGLVPNGPQVELHFIPLTGRASTLGTTATGATRSADLSSSGPCNPLVRPYCFGSRTNGVPEAVFGAQYIEFHVEVGEGSVL